MNKLNQFDKKSVTRISNATRFVESIARNFETANYGKRERFIQRPFACRVTAVSGSFPQWSYTCQRVTGYDSTQTAAARWVTDGIDITGCINTMEQSGTPTYTFPTGVSITSSTGQVNSTACVIKSIGVGAVVDLSFVVDSAGVPVFRFAQPNSAT